MRNSAGDSAAVFVPKNDEEAMMDAVSSGPVSVAIDASGSYFQQYK